MASVRGRIDALEKRAGEDRGDCECGNLRIVYEAEGEEPRCDDPNPVCKHCGRERVTVRVVYGNYIEGRHVAQEKEQRT